MVDAYELRGYLDHGKLILLPSKRKKKLAVLSWLAEHIPPSRKYTEREFNELLDILHTFEDPATLRRELYDFGLINRNQGGTCYWLNPEHPSLQELLAKYCNDTQKSLSVLTNDESLGIEYDDHDLKAAENFRNRIHAIALERVQQILPDVTSVVDRYSVEEYFKKIWDYPGAWYTIVAVPEKARSREALIDIIVRDTIKNQC